MSFRSVIGASGRVAKMVVLATVLSFLGIVLLQSGANADTGYDSEELQFLDLINEYREQNGLGDLILSDDITVAAEHHNEDMAEYDFFAHDTVQSSYYPDGSQPWDRMSAEGYDYNTYKGENLAVGYETAEEALQAWKDSPSHNAAMLDGNYRVVGISRIRVPGSEYEWYWTTDFGAYEDPSSHEPGADSDEAAEADGTAGSFEKAERKNTLKNGKFVGKKGWKQEASDGAKLILEGEFVRMGDYDDGFDELTQQVRVGDDAVLSYGLKVTTEESREFRDEMRVRLTDEDGKRLGLLRTYTGEDAGEWGRQRVKLPEKFAGKKVTLSFVTKTDDRDDTSFFLDDVSLVSAF